VRGLATRQRYPSRPFNLGLFSYYLGDNRSAEEWFAAAARDRAEKLLADCERLRGRIVEQVRPHLP